MSVLGLEMETSSKNISKHQRRQIIRGKRTKRSRPLTAVTSSSSTGCTSGGNDAYFSIPSPASSGQNNSTCTEEDEDMANCLILLAKSASCPKLIGQKFTETTTATAGKAGCYVYECKTCNRNFPSFQALGGHRASHKKPRVPISGENNKFLNTTLNKEDQEDVQLNKVISPSIFANKSLQSGTNNNKAKVHECSICGSEFASGQALGGHMRRHRITTPPTNGNSTNIIDDHDQKKKPITNILQLDLNLPAPEDDHVDSKFPMVFSAPAPLVGCHY